MSGLVGAMGAAISGIAAQSMRFGSISDNIANAASVGYKTSRVNFQNTLSTMAAPLQLPGAVKPTVHQNLSVAGALQGSANNGDIALLGNGFFAVANRLTNDGTAVAGNSDRALTRRGDFKIDKNGNLINSDNMALLGVAIPTQIPVYDDGILKLQTVTARQSERISSTGASLAGDAGLSVLTPIQIGQNAVVPAVTASNIYVGINLPANEPLQNGQIYSTTTSVIDRNGDAQNLKFTFQRNGYEGDPLPNGGMPQNIWDVTVTGDNVSPTAFQLSFDNTGHIVNLTSSIFSVTVAGSPMSVSFDGGKINGKADSTKPYPSSTQFDSKYSDYGSVSDGKPSGKAVGWSISNNGIVSQSFSNGLIIPRYQIALGSAANNDGLQAINGMSWVESPQSGKIRVYLSSYGVTDAAAGTNTLETAILSGSLESSTVELATEFARMIETQHNYSANTKVLGVVDQMNAQTAQLGR